MKKVISLLLVVTLLCCFVGCSGDPAAKTETVNYGTLKLSDGSDAGVDIDWSLFEYYARNTMHDYAEYYGNDVTALKESLNVDQGGTTLAEQIKSQGLEFIKNFYGVQILAKQHNISLTQEEKDSLAEQKRTALESGGGQENFDAFLSQNYLTEANYDALMENNALINKLLSALFGEGGVHEIPKEDIVKNTSENYVRVVHILIQADPNAADFQEKTNYANDVLARANAGEDFMALVSELSEDPGSKSQPDGYVFDKEGYTLDGSQMVTEFVDGSWALEVGQHSGLVQTSYGYHIIKRLPLDEEYITANYDQFHSYAAQLAFDSELIDVSATLIIETNDAFKNLDVATFIPKLPEATEPPAPAEVPAQ